MAVSRVAFPVQEIIQRFDQKQRKRSVSEVDHRVIQQIKKTTPEALDDYFKNVYLKQNPSVDAMLECYIELVGGSKKQITENIDQASKIIESQLKISDLWREVFIEGTTVSHKKELMEQTPVLKKLREIEQLKRPVEAANQLLQVKPDLANGLPIEVQMHVNGELLKLSKTLTQFIKNKNLTTIRGYVNRWSIFEKYHPDSIFRVLAILSLVYACFRRNKIPFFINMIISLTVMVMSITLYEVLVTPIIGLVTWVWKAIFGPKDRASEVFIGQIHQALPQSET